MAGSLYRPITEEILGLRLKGMKLKFLITFILLTSNASFAALDFEDHAFPELVTSARALAMGNAFINRVDDSWSAFYNPAGLGTVRRPTFHLANIHLESSSKLLSAMSSGPAYQIPKNYIDSYDPEEMRSLLVKNQGELMHSRVNLFPNLTVRGLTLGYMFSQRNRSIINDDAANEFEIAERRDHGPVMALNASFFGGVFKVGASAVYLMRRDLYKTFGPTENINISDSDYRGGNSVQVTAGARLTLPYDYLPTFSAVLRNATDSKFTKGDDYDLEPEKIKQTVDVGVSITPQIGQATRLHLELNLKDLNNSYDTDAKRRLAAGMELDIARKLFLRAGYGDGWGSGGIGVKLRRMTLDLTTYAIDRSLDGFREKEDRRWVLSFASGF